jgi:hypothetical protein
MSFFVCHLDSDWSPVDFSDWCGMEDSCSNLWVEYECKDEANYE